MRARPSRLRRNKSRVSYLPCGDSLPTFLFFCSWLSGLRTALGNTTTQAEVVQTTYNSSQQELEELRAAALEIC
jgi:hypothetical protein